MLELCMNLYPPTLKSIISDLVTQLEDYTTTEHKMEGDDKKIEDLKELLSIPMSVHIKYSQFDREEYLNLAKKYDVVINTSKEFLNS